MLIHWFIVKFLLSVQRRKVLILFCIIKSVVFHSVSTCCSCVQVDIRFPQPGSDEPDKVTVTGLPETVDNAIDHLLNLEEEYVS